MGEMEGHGWEERRDMVGRDGGHVGRDGGTWLGGMEEHGCKGGIEDMVGRDGRTWLGGTWFGGMEGHGLEG